MENPGTVPPASPSPSPAGPSPSRQNGLRLLYWAAAAAMTVALILELLGDSPDFLAVGSRASLVIALVLLATAKPVETRGKKTAIYALVVVALGLLIARLLR